MKIIIDRVSGNEVYAELPDLTVVKLPLALLPDAKEGKCYIIEEVENDNKDNIKKLMDEVFK